MVITLALSQNSKEKGSQEGNSFLSTIYSRSKIPRPRESKFQHVIPGHSKLWFSWFERKELMSLGLLLNIVNIPSLDNLGTLTPNLTFPWFYQLQESLLKKVKVPTQMLIFTMAKDILHLLFRCKAFPRFENKLFMYIRCLPYMISKNIQGFTSQIQVKPHLTKVGLVYSLSLAINSNFNKGMWKSQ